jgi:hypothetical protein
VNLAQSIIDRNLEEFTQLVVIALAKKAGGTLQLMERDLAEAQHCTVDVGVGSSGVTLTVKGGLTPERQERAKNYFAKRPKTAPSGRVKIVGFN